MNAVDTDKIYRSAGSSDGEHEKGGCRYQISVCGMIIIAAAAIIIIIVVIRDSVYQGWPTSTHRRAT
jgi:hypothetical protein